MAAFGGGQLPLQEDGRLQSCKFGGLDPGGLDAGDLDHVGLEAGWLACWLDAWLAGLFACLLAANWGGDGSPLVLRPHNTSKRTCLQFAFGAKNS